MEYIVEKENKIKKLSDEEKYQIANRICSNFKTYDDSRQKNLLIAQKLIKEIYFKTETPKKDKNESWKSDIKMCKIYMFFQTLKSFIWKSTYSGINSMFDVSGESLEADNDSNKQKAALVDVLEKMDFSKTSDTVIDYSLIYGELISFSTWRKKVEEYRRPITFFETLFKTDVQKLSKIIEAKSKGKNFYIDERVIYDNPDIIPVNPADFVFDVSQKDFDTTPKLHRTWRTPEDIINNKFYEISKSVAEEIRNMVKKSPDISDNSDQSSQKLSNVRVNGSCVEVIEHWGNYTLENGTVLKNWHAVIIGGKFLVRFEKNPFIINPFTYGAYLLDYETQRGISPLASVLGLTSLQETLMNKTVDLQSLTENPPTLAPKGFFENDENILRPGKVLNYDASLYRHSLIKPFTFNPGIFLTDITFLSDLMSEISGIFPNMSGASEQSDKTATEISVKTQGQSTRLSMILDVISQYYILPCVKNIAKLCANFKFGIENIFINKDNNPENVVITDDIRQAEYRYTYSDRNATTERLNYADMLIVAIEKFAQMVPLDIPQIYCWYMEQKGMESPERFLLKNQMQNQMQNNIPTEEFPNLQQPEAPVPIDSNGILPQTPSV